jgi:hypothetical protein
MEQAVKHISQKRTEKIKRFSFPSIDISPQASKFKLFCPAFHLDEAE